MLLPITSKILSRIILIRLNNAVALLAHRHQDIQSKTEELTVYGKQIGLIINKKTKLMKLNSKSVQPLITNDNKVEEFTYLGGKITSDGVSGADVQSRISKARGAFAALKIIWRASNTSIKSKLRIFKSNESDTGHLSQAVCVSDKMPSVNSKDILAHDNLQ